MTIHAMYRKMCRLQIIQRYMVLIWGFFIMKMAILDILEKYDGDDSCCGGTFETGALKSGNCYDTAQNSAYTSVVFRMGMQFCSSLLIRLADL